MSPRDVMLDLAVADKAALFEALGHHIDDEPEIGQRLIVTCLMRREQAGSTGLGDGLALPHARVEGLARIHVLYARLAAPIAYGAPDGKPVSEILALLVPSPGTEEHLQLLASAARMLSDTALRARLRAGADRREVFRLFSEWSAAQAAD